jgi:hypothetical protein
VLIDPDFHNYLFETFRSLDAALDEHKAKGTKTGDAVYGRIFEQLGDDVAATGFGKDDLAEVANQVGQLSTYNRLRGLMPKQLNAEEQEAITNLEDQIAALAAIRANPEHASADSPEFIGWKASTTDMMSHYIPSQSELWSKFRFLHFRSNVMQGDFGSRRQYLRPPDHSREFNSDADIAAVCLKGAIEQIRVFGLKQAEPASPAKFGRARESRGLTQVFHGPVNQAVAMDRATQNVGQVGSAGSHLHEIVQLLQASYELTKRQVEDASNAAQKLDAEVQKPETAKSWKSIAEWGTTLLGLADKATDLTEKLAPHLPWLAALLEKATNHL